MAFKRTLIFTFFVLCLAVNPAWAATWYVTATDSGGTGAGSYSDPWQTFSNIPSDGTIADGDTLKLLSGTYREQLTVNFGNTGAAYVTIDASEATILGSENYNSTGDWTNSSGNIWETSDTFTTNVGFVLFGSEAQSNVGNKVDAEASLVADKDFYCADGGVLKVYSSSGNPATVWTNVEVASRQYALHVNNYDYVYLKGGTYKYFNAVGIRLNQVNNVKVYNTSVLYGGGFFFSLNRAGTGIQLSGESSNIYIYGNTISQIWDSGISPQIFADSSDINITTVYIYSNMLSNSACGVELGVFANDSSLTDVKVYDNDIYNLGYGWSGYTVPTLKGRGISVLAKTSTRILEADIYNNKVDTAAQAGIKVDGGEALIHDNWITGITSDVTTDYPAGISINGGAVDPTVSIYRNVVVDNTGVGIHVRSMSTASYLYNNVIVDNTTYGIRAESADNIVIKNNIISGEDYCIWRDSTGTITSDYNNVYRSDSGDEFLQGTTSRDLASWQTATGQDINSLDSDPKTTSTYRLYHNSPCLAAGTTTSYTEAINPNSVWPGLVDVTAPHSTNIGPWAWEDYLLQFGGTHQ